MTRIIALLGKCCFLGLLASCLCCLTLGQVSVVTQHNDNNRTGQNTSETILTTSNVNVSNFGKLFTLTVDGDIYAQPLYLPNVTIGGSLHNVVYVATEHNSVYAFDADDANGTTLWQAKLGPSVPSDDVCGSPGCNNYLVPEIGITATPVIDPQGGVLYVAVKNKDSNGSYHYRLHALNVSSGAEMLGGPAEISASHFTPLFQLNRAGLLLSGGKVYVAFGSVGDTIPWYGFVMAYDAGTLAQLAVLNTSPSLISGGSIWGGGQGPVADNAGNVYVITANGDFNANTPGGHDYSTSFLKLDGSNLSVLDYFTPDNQSYLGNFDYDVDLGSGGPLLIPGTTLLLGGGKDGILRLVASGNMGKFNSGFNNNVQQWQAISGRIMGAPVYWNSPTLGAVVYLWGDGQPMQAWSFKGQTFQTSPVSQGTILNPAGYSNMAPLSISSNGSTAGTGIVWAAAPRSGNANVSTVPGQLLAFDASDLTHELWDSQQDGARDGVGNFAKFNPPTIANGKVYLATFSNHLLVYGLLNPPDFSLDPPSAGATIPAGESAQYTISVGSQNGFSSPVDLACSGLPSGLSCSFNPSSLTPTSGGGVVNSTLTVSTLASTSAGTYSVTITGTSGSVSHSGSVNLTVQAVPDFSLSASPMPAPVTAGGSATSTVTLVPSGGFTGTVTISCSIITVASPPPTCSLNPAAPITTSGAPVTSTLTVSTTAAHASAAPSRSIYYATWLPLGVLALLGTGFTSRKKRLLCLLLFCLVFSGLLFLASCGGGSSTRGGGGGGTPGTPPGTYSIAVTATAGTLQHATTVTLTVQ
jgi:hypothetical protein